jgi:UDP-N-acetylglucosamine:LPS N-acetylglucosamine transferase
VKGEDRPILILTAGMGEGHNGVARELQRRLEALGHRVEVIDVLGLLPLRLGALMRAFYSWMVRLAPWLYDLIYRFWFEPASSGRTRNIAGPVSPVTGPIQRKVARWIDEHHPTAAVSTFHLCSQVLGDLKRRGRLVAPAVTVIVDMAVHRLWIHPDVDLHQCFHPVAAAEARRRAAISVSTPGPVVRQEFYRTSWDRDSARESIGVPPDEKLVLVAGGSWGVGAVQETAAMIARSGRYQALVVCGHNETLARRLAVIPGVRVLGWVEDMARPMIAANAVVDNAGGLTCMEALATGTPVVGFSPIPGHGRANLRVMAKAGIIADASENGLLAALDGVTSGAAEMAALKREAESMFTGDAAHEIDTLARGRPGGGIRTRRRSAGRRRRRLSS